MSASTRLINKLDKALSVYDSFGDDPIALVDEVFGKIEKPLNKLRSKSKPDLMAEIYVERDRAIIKQEILNRVMAGWLEQRRWTAVNQSDLMACLNTNYIQHL